MLKRLLIYAAFAWIASGAPRLKRTVVSTSTDELSATGTDTANVDAQSASAMENGNLNAAIVSAGNGTGSDYSKANLSAIAAADFENNTVASSSGTGLVDATGTNTDVTATFGATLNNANAESVAGQEAVASGSESAGVTADAKNDVTNGEPSSEPTKERQLLGSAGGEATQNVLAQINQYQQVTSNNATSLLAALSTAKGSDQSNAQVLANLIINSQDALAASAVGNAIGKDTNADTYDTLYDVEIDGETVQQSAIAQSNANAGGGEDSEILASATASDPSDTVVVNGDAQGHAADGSSTADGSAVASTDLNNGAAAMASHSGTATGKEVETAATNSIGVDGSDGQKTIVGTGSFNGDGNQETNTGQTEVNSYYEDGEGASASSSNGKVSSVSGTANSQFGNGAYVEGSNGERTSENAGKGTAKGDTANVETDSNAVAATNESLTSINMNADAGGAGSSSLDTEGQSKTNDMGSGAEANGGTSMDAKGDVTDLMSNLQLGINGGNSAGMTNTSGSATGAGTVTMSSSSYLQTSSDKRRKKRQTSSSAPEFATITVVCNNDGSRKCEYGLSKYDKESGKWVPSNFSNLFSLLQWLMRNQNGNFQESDNADGSNAQSYAYTSVTSNGVTRSSFVTSP